MSDEWPRSPLRSGTFETFSRERDLHTLSHRSLTQELIPRWLAEGAELDSLIVSAAYGETPPAVIIDILEFFRPKPEDILLDVGAGGGGVLALMLAAGWRAYGIEQNRALVVAGREYLRSQDMAPESLIEGDFLDGSFWPPATLLYTANSRYSPTSLERLSEQVRNRDSLRRVVALGQQLTLGPRFRLISSEPRDIVWNRGEPVRSETLYFWEDVRACQ